jgi:hypothetical protein
MYFLPLLIVSLAQTSLPLLMTWLVTPEIEKVSEHAVTHGGDNDVYIGRWLGQEMVCSL